MSRIFAMCWAGKIYRYFTSKWYEVASFFCFLKQKAEAHLESFTICTQIICVRRTRGKNVHIQAAYGNQQNTGSLLCLQFYCDILHAHTQTHKYHINMYICMHTPSWCPSNFGLLQWESWRLQFSQWLKPGTRLRSPICVWADLQRGRLLESTHFVRVCVHVSVR